MQGTIGGIPWQLLWPGLVIMGLAGLAAGGFAFLGVLLAVKRPFGKLPFFYVPLVFLLTCLIPLSPFTFLLSWLGSWLYVKWSKQTLELQKQCPNAPLRFSLRSALYLTLAISVFMACGRVFRTANLSLLSVSLAIAAFAAVAVWSSFHAAAAPLLVISYWLTALGVLAWVSFVIEQDAFSLLLTACFSGTYAVTLQVLLRPLRNRGYRLVPARPAPSNLRQDTANPDEAVEAHGWFPWATYRPKRRPEL